ncbi:PREDICTED: uncharacterized protein LOC105962227 [Erythranthe guttata]|nr:PREDICTED: uncharacterized protein LOC105962227 [Erythranthe guttata]|eukprot:XP_012841984.1 PREDICTED: uncharacterized protein LOC105962227 [Erythranthe guttata]
MDLRMSWLSFIRIFLLLLLIAATIIACFTLPVEQMLKDFLVWIDQDLGYWGPVVLAVAYIPLTILAVPASVLTLGGGYLFGLPIGFIADSVGATLGAGAAFLLGRTLGRSFVISKLNDYPKFHAVAIAIQRSGFKVYLRYSEVIVIYPKKKTPRSRIIGEWHTKAAKNYYRLN